MNREERENLRSDIVAAITQGFRNQSSPSKETANFMRKTELSIQDIKKDIERISEKLDDISTFIRNADDRYASKETERSLKRIMWIVITGVIAALLALVVKT